MAIQLFPVDEVPQKKSFVTRRKTTMRKRILLLGVGLLMLTLFVRRT